jgi:hypothetical protein
MAGSSAAALTGLMFVVISLITGLERAEIPSTQDGIATFSTPTVMHFAAALLLCAILLAPWGSLAHPAIVAALIGLAGVAYILRVMQRTVRLRVYRADVEDWIWYNILPFVAYGAIAAGAIALAAVPGRALFIIAGGIVLLLFIGIRNAWDVVTYLAVPRR